MRGQLERRRWRPDPDLYAPARYRRPCDYDAFIPDSITALGVELSGIWPGRSPMPESAIAALNAEARPALLPLARLLLRTEAVARPGRRDADGRAGTREGRGQVRHGATAGAEATEILANIDAMQLAVEDAATIEHLAPHHFEQIHAAPLKSAPRSAGAGAIRDEQNWIGGNDYNPCGADFVRHRPKSSTGCSPISAPSAAKRRCPPLVQAAIAHAQFETHHPFNDGNGRSGQSAGAGYSCGGVAWRRTTFPHQRCIGCRTSAVHRWPGELPGVAMSASGSKSSRWPAPGRRNSRVATSTMSAGCRTAGANALRRRHHREPTR